jgi:hypothetical protein
MAQKLVLITPLVHPSPVPPGGTPGSPPVVTPTSGTPYFATLTYLEAEGPGDGGGTVSPPIYLPPGVWPNPPDRPPGIWPSPPGWPGHPAHPLPPGSGLPTHPIFLPPGVWPHPPGSPGEPTHPIVLPPDPDEPPGTVWPPLDPPVAQSGYLIAWVPGQGYKYVKVTVPPEKPSTKPPVPETPQPKPTR